MDKNFDHSNWTIPDSFVQQIIQYTNEDDKYEGEILSKIENGGEPDQLSLKYLSEMAFVEAKAFKILTPDQYETYTNDLSSLISKIQSSKRKLALKSKITNAELSLSKVASNSKKNEEQKTSDTPYLEELIEELLSLQRKRNVMEKILLKHHVAVLSETCKIDDSEYQNQGQNPLSGFESLVMTLGASSEYANELEAKVAQLNAKLAETQSQSANLRQNNNKNLPPGNTKNYKINGIADTRKEFQRIVELIRSEVSSETLTRVENTLISTQEKINKDSINDYSSDINSAPNKAYLNADPRITALLRREFRRAAMDLQNECAFSVQLEHEKTQKLQTIISSLKK